MTNQATAVPLRTTTPLEVDAHGVPTSGRPWLVLALVCLAQFMVILDATVTNVALPSIGHDLHLTGVNLQWIVNAYTLMFGGFLLLGGRAADLLGRKRLFMAGLGLFTAASLVNGLAGDGAMLIIARGVQGLGGALVSPAALSIVIATFPEGPARTKAMGIWGGIAAGGSAFGLLLGGMLTSWASWRWAFFINVPIGLATAVYALRFVPESRGDLNHRNFDFFGAVTVTGGLVSLVYGIVKAQSWGWTDSKTLGMFALAAALLIAFTITESMQKAPLIRLGIFRVRSIVSANLTMLMVGAGMFSMFYFVGLYLQNILGYSAVKAGVAFMPISIAIIAGATLSTSIMAKTGVRVITTIGLVLTVIGMALLLRVGVDSSYAGTLLPALLPLSLGMGLVFVPLTLVATTNVEGPDMGLASGLFNTSQQLGGALGLAILATIAVSHTANVHAIGATAQNVATVGGFHQAFLWGTVIMGIALVAFVGTIRKRDVATIENGDMSVPII